MLLLLQPFNESAPAKYEQVAEFFEYFMPIADG